MNNYLVQLFTPRARDFGGKNALQLVSVTRRLASYECESLVGVVTRKLRVRTRLNYAITQIITLTF